MEKSDKIGVLGGGIEGMALLKYLVAHEFENVTLFDELMTDADDIPKGVNVVFGENAFDHIFDCNVLFRSPGVHPDRLSSAVSLGIKVTSTIQFFLQNCKGKTIGVTGTKGKGTTSTLIYEILREAGRDVYLGGNIGESPLKFLDKMNADSWGVLELSSFQLMDLSLSPNVSVVLMTTTDHLDYHADTDEYIDAKTSIARFQQEEDVLVVNVDYKSSERFIGLGKGNKLTVSTQDVVESGAYVSDGKIFFVSCGDGICKREEICLVEKVGLPGPHNIENILAATAVARSIGIPIEAISKAVYSFSGLEHRLEFVKEVDGVKYYNDSFSTTPETSIAASKAFMAPTIMICGGSEKHSDFSDWALELQNNPNVGLIFLIGVTSDRMEKALLDVKDPVHPAEIVRAKSLQEALQKARLHAKKGDYVIMSPAAASFDMFKNYKVRGATFKEIVNDIFL